jgi:succinate dehydrogenase/fumarate reductase flavoprotein subunit
MKQQHIFLVSIVHDEEDNYLSTKVIQGPVKREFQTVYVVDNDGHDYWASKSIFTKFDVSKDYYIPEGHERPTIHYNMGFIWNDGDDENYVRYMADECQRRCKLPIIDRLNELRNEIEQSIEKLIKSKTCVVI